MAGKNWNYLRHWSGKAFAYDSRYGAYGTGNKAQGKKNAQERASALRRAGGLARITLERQDYGSYWVVWSHGGR